LATPGSSPADTSIRPSSPPKLSPISLPHNPGNPVILPLLTRDAPFNASRCFFFFIVILAVFILLPHSIFLLKKYSRAFDVFLATGWTPSVWIPLSLAPRNTLCLCPRSSSFPPSLRTSFQKHTSVHLPEVVCFANGMVVSNRIQRNPSSCLLFPFVDRKLLMARRGPKTSRAWLC